MSRVGFIGLGAMGAPMARHLARLGALVAVANRSPGKAAALAAELGVEAFPASTIGAACETVLLCVSADADVLGCVDALAATLAPGGLVIDTSTVGPATAREAAARLAAAGIGFVDAPVSGGVEGARQGRLSVMAGGSEADIARARPLLAAFAARITHMGPVGAGQAAKAVNQVMVAGIAQAVCEALALAERLDLPADALLPTLAAGAAANWFLDKRGASMLAGEFAVGFQSRLLLKDLGIVRQLASELGFADVPVVDRALEDYARLVAAGYGGEDISSLFRLRRHPECAAPGASPSVS